MPIFQNLTLECAGIQKNVQPHCLQVNVLSIESGDHFTARSGWVIVYKTNHSHFLIINLPLPHAGI